MYYSWTYFMIHVFILTIIIIIMIIIMAINLKVYKPGRLVSMVWYYAGVHIILLVHCMYE